ncbi:MAG: hypothetical protein ABI818_11335 [Acidobacteriota bacterium]
MRTAAAAANGALPIVTVGPADPLRARDRLRRGPAGTVSAAEIYIGGTGPLGTYV